jgi:hypothetical protein
VISPSRILVVIDKFVDRWGWEVCYTFGHIVLDDYNLGDSSIAVCLEYEAIKESKLSEMEQAVLALLQWLQTIPEDIRMQAQDLYHGNQ